MNTNKNLTIDEALSIAITKHQQNKLNEAQILYNKILEVNPNHTQVLSNLGAIFNQLGEKLKAKNYFEKAIELNPNYPDAHNNLGVIFKETGETFKAKDCYEKAIELNPNYIEAYNNLGIILKILGEYKRSISCHEKAIELNPNYIEAYNNLGNVFQELGENLKAKDCYEKAIQLNPNYVHTYWNLHGLSTNIEEALSLLKKLHKIDNEHTKAKIMIAALEGYKGNFKMFDEVLNSSNSNHPSVRSVKWVFSLGKLPNIFFNRWLFFDAVIKLADSSRPFYEFGVWRGISFQYLINTFKKGFGFDTFTGLPEDWHNQKKGEYSAFGVIPQIKGGEFIAGKFEDTLPDFFLKERPMASIINFDADLYSSTLCALNNSKKVIDEKTILIFDELLMNDKWEEDEYKALNEFCDNMGYNYEVIYVSFFTNQVALKLKKN